jgi:hypothetical protein
LKRNATQKTQNAKSERERAYFFWILFSKNIFSLLGLIFEDFSAMTFLPSSYAILSLQLCHFVPPAMPFCPFFRFAMPFCPSAFTPHVVFMIVESLQNCTFPSTQKISVIKNNIENHIAR